LLPSLQLLFGRHCGEDNKDFTEYGALSDEELPPSVFFSGRVCLLHNRFVHNAFCCFCLGFSASFFFAFCCFPFGRRVYSCGCPWAVGFLGALPHPLPLRCLSPPPRHVGAHPMRLLFTSFSLSAALRLSPLSQSQHCRIFFFLFLVLDAQNREITTILESCCAVLISSSVGVKRCAWPIFFFPFPLLTEAVFGLFLRASRNRGAFCALDRSEVLVCLVMVCLQSSIVRTLSPP